MACSCALAERLSHRGLTGSGQGIASNHHRTTRASEYNNYSYTEGALRRPLVRAVAELGAESGRRMKLCPGSPCSIHHCTACASECNNYSYTEGALRRPFVRALAVLGAESGRPISLCPVSPCSTQRRTQPAAGAQSHLSAVFIDPRRPAWRTRPQQAGRAAWSAQHRAQTLCQGELAARPRPAHCPTA